MWNKYTKTIGSLALLIALAYPTYDIMRDFANQRDGRMQSTSYEFSRYLRDRGII
ncbi:hypothetical protein IQ215_09590 [Cyanobacterium stanieri LEGE 03274]|uniref:Uncharacterized protein n=1 Tax=Cyanobacterium stanieri LEGE 03274 TaxID=1828756 RepID=A0ABR9V4Y0_9CHRO|nr:hypothetical protein [Cyanobacterium stanieri]MBE9222945.1 hypothetical protein [Cyanobacterium stanieri LEGE 03274]